MVLWISKKLDTDRDQRDREEVLGRTSGSEKNCKRPSREHTYADQVRSGGCAAGLGWELLLLTSVDSTICRPDICAVARWMGSLWQLTEAGWAVKVRVEER